MQGSPFRVGYRGGQAPIIAAYHRALPLLVWIYELPFLFRLLREESPSPAFWAEYKISPLSVRIFAGQPVQVGYHSPPFWAGVGAGKYRSPPAAAGSSASRPPLFAGCRTFSACIKAAAGRAPVYCKAQVTAEGGRRRRFALRAKPTAKPSSPPPCGGRAACGAPPGGSAHARGHSPSRSNRKSCGSFILCREQYPIRCGSTTVSSSPCRFLSAHK